MNPRSVVLVIPRLVVGNHVCCAPAPPIPGFAPGNQWHLAVLPVYSRLSDHSRRSMRAVARLLHSNSHPSRFRHQLSFARAPFIDKGFIADFRVVYRLPPGDPCCSFGFHLTASSHGLLLPRCCSELSNLTRPIHLQTPMFSGTEDFQPAAQYDASKADSLASFAILFSSSLA